MVIASFDGLGIGLGFGVGIGRGAETPTLGRSGILAGHVRAAYQCGGKGFCIIVPGYMCGRGLGGNMSMGSVKAGSVGLRFAPRSFSLRRTSEIFAVRNRSGNGCAYLVEGRASELFGGLGGRRCIPFYEG